jgi:DEPDC5 protein C-terminal region
MEWIEIVVDSTFNTQWSYRIILNWLVASSGKVDTQVQLLQRRCVQFGLNLVPFPQVTVSRSVFLNPFKAPVIYRLVCPKQGAAVDEALTRIDFLHDGVFYTDMKAILDVVEDRQIFNMAMDSIAGRQYVHRTGTLFVRIFTDKQGLVLIVVLGNYRILQTGSKEDSSLEQAYRAAFFELSRYISSL